MAPRTGDENFCFTTDAREALDGHYLHNDVQSYATYLLLYNGDLSRSDPHGHQDGDVRYSTRSVVGEYVCHCRGPRHPSWRWTSGKICTEVLFSPATGHYRTRLHSQKCKFCESYAEPRVNIESYVTKLVDVFDMWKGLRRRRERSGRAVHRTPPHHPDRCHGCLVGVCEQVHRRSSGYWY
ncbi:hypothetical protein BGZ59_001733 [Podila verticillata]|nr:hypothetical protein BGZ59_001733 [Podila verticillata]KAI9232351.1 MAG: hypothetical protein BYD32DRAFT_441035 [Podila humilis]KFH66314.1 hypothetical protein MVEG_08413 [Podila verticillata NRRL 6337]